MIFSYAILYSTLSLYLNEIIGYSKHHSNSLMGIFIACNFLLHFFAGYLGGFWINNKQLLILALSSQCVGSMFLQYHCLYVGLSFFLIGCGFGITCLNCLLTEQFEHQDQQREKAFFINYAALNFGSFLGFLVSGCFYFSQNFDALFRINTSFSLITLLLLLLLRKNIKTVAVSPNLKKRSVHFFIGLAIASSFLFVLLGFYFENAVSNIIIIASLFAVIYIVVQAKNSMNNTEKNKLYVFLLFLVSAICFWTLYFIAPWRLYFF